EAAGAGNGAHWSRPRQWGNHTGNRWNTRLPGLPPNQATAPAPDPTLPRARFGDRESGLPGCAGEAGGDVRGAVATAAGRHRRPGSPASTASVKYVLLPRPSWGLRV